MRLRFLKLRASYKAVLGLLWREKSYLWLAAFLSLVTLTVLLWAFNINLLAYILTQSGLSLGSKISFIFGVYRNVITYFGDPQATSLLIISPLLGINMAVAIYVLRARSRQVSAVGKSSLGFVGALLGSGCAVCGTGILGPLLVGLGSTSAIVVAKVIGLIANLVAIGLLLYSIYGLGKVIPFLGSASRIPDPAGED